MNDKLSEERECLFREATAIVEKEILSHERHVMPKPDFWLRRKLKHAISLLERVLVSNPESWPSMWFIGKIHQRLDDKVAALSWFERAYQINPSQPDVAREASMCAMDIGRNEAAISFSYRGVQIEPQSAGLHANLALAYLLANRIPDALASINQALMLDPQDEISKTIRDATQHFATNGRRPPETTPQLLSYWSKNGKQ